MEIYGADLQGIEGQLVRFTATKDEGRSGVQVLGLAGKVVKEGLSRAEKAIETLKGDWSKVLSSQGYTIDLSPAETPKTSSGLDLPIAITFLQASILGNVDALNAEIKQLELRIRSQSGGSRGQLREKAIQLLRTRIKERELIAKYRRRLSDNKTKYLLIAKLDITSGLLNTPQFGMFGMMAAARPGFTVVVPEEAEAHGALIASRNKRISALVAKDLQEVWNVLLGTAKGRRARKTTIRKAERTAVGYVPDLREIEGVSRGKRALIVALAGGHNIMLVGPPGQGKTMLAKASSQLLPALTSDEVFELNKVYSARGALLENEIVAYRPYREVQSSGITPAALFGGGARTIRPGEISLAHKGVLLVDEINLCAASIIEQLRNTLNGRTHKVQRHLATVEFPCDFILFAAMNPCKCGWYGHYTCPECERVLASKELRCAAHPKVSTVTKCSCSKAEVNAYLQKLSRPLLDRIDLKVMVSAFDEKPGDDVKYASVTVRKQIETARAVQQARYEESKTIECNADVHNRAVLQRLAPSLPAASERYFAAIAKQVDSKRVQVKILLVARTVADLSGSRHVRVKDVREACNLMGLTDGYFRPLH